VFKSALISCFRVIEVVSRVCVRVNEECQKRTLDRLIGSEYHTRILSHWLRIPHKTGSESS
jgi:hypothetical protein